MLPISTVGDAAAMYNNKPVILIVLKILILPFLIGLLCPPGKAELNADMKVNRIHPILKFSKASQLIPEMLDSAAFKSLNNLYYASDCKVFETQDGLTPEK